MKTTNLTQSGVIHTLEMHIRKREGINLEQTFVDKKPPKRVARSYWDSNQRGLSIQINPNNEGKISSESGKWLTYGNCPSTEQLEHILQKWAAHKGLKRDDLQIRRTDFAIDCKNEKNAAQFKKLADLLITALVIKHDVNRKNQFICSDILTRKAKSISAKAVPSPYEFICYDKRNQSPRNDAIWRLELRYKADLRYKGSHAKCSILNMLNSLSKEVASLADYYEKTLSVLNLQLYHEYMTLQDNCTEQLSPYQFLVQNTERVFCRMQVENFFALLGKDGKQANNCAKYFSDHYCHFYVSKNGFKLLIKEIRNHIKNYITSDAVFANYDVNCK